MSKIFFFANQLHLNKNNPQKNWNILQSVLPGKKNEIQDLTDAFGENNHPKKIADKFKNFFCSIGEDLANKISSQNDQLFQNF